MAGQAVKAAGNAQTYMEQAGQIKTDTQTIADNASQSMAEVITKAQADINAQGTEIITQATAQADRAQGAADGIRDTADTLQADNEHLKAELKHANRRISVLYDLGKGITHRYETDSETAYSKDVPSGAKVMDVKLIGGKSVVGNQLTQDVKFEQGVDNGIWQTWNANVLTEGGVASFKTVKSWAGLMQDIQFTANHKYYISVDVRSDIANNSALAPYVQNINNQVKLTTTQWTQCDILFPSTDDKRLGIGVRASSIDNDAISGATISFKNMQCIDLTQMFGAGNEPTLEQCREIFASESYPYNAGALTSADVTAVQVGDKVIPLPNSISLKSAGSVYDSLEFYEQDGKYYQKHTQRVGVVDLGTLTWNYAPNSNNQYRFYAPIANIKPNDRYDDVANCLCIKYQTDNANNVFNNVKDKTIAVPTKSEIWIHDSTYNNVGDFTTAMQGVLLYYELATPIVTVTEIDNRFDAVDVSTGDKITFVGNSDYHLPVPNEQEYLIALNEVRA